MTNEAVNSIDQPLDPLHRPLTSVPVLLLSTESAAGLEELQRDWERDYPGDSTTIRALRDNLAAADWEHRRARLNFQEFQLHSERETSLPLYMWDTSHLERYALLQRHAHQASRDFYRALKALESSFKPPALQPKISPEKIPASPPSPPTKGTIMQNVEVTVVDGQVITTTDFSARFWANHKRWENASDICRQFHFPDALIPEPYAYVLLHRGIAYEPAENIDLSYLPDEFARLCWLELETGSPHLLDGVRCGYHRHT